MWALNTVLRCTWNGQTTQLCKRPVKMPVHFCSSASLKIQQHNTSGAVMCLYEFHFRICSSCLFVLRKFFVCAVYETCWGFGEMFVVGLRFLHFCAWISVHFKPKTFHIRGDSKVAVLPAFAPKVKCVWSAATAEQMKSVLVGNWRKLHHW